jgi:hypothetical protein
MMKQTFVKQVVRDFVGNGESLCTSPNLFRDPNHTSNSLQLANYPASLRIEELRRFQIVKTEKDKQLLEIYWSTNPVGDLS